MGIAAHPSDKRRVASESLRRKDMLLDSTYGASAKLKGMSTIYLTANIKGLRALEHYYESEIHG